MSRSTATAGKRNRCSLNGSVATVAALRALGEHLIDIHGQNEHQSLLRPAAQLEVLDRFGGLEDARAEFALIRGELLAAHEHRAELERDRQLRAERREMLERTVREISEAAPVVGEDEELEQTCRRLRHAERYRAALETSGDALYEGDDSVATRLGGVLRRLREVEDLDPEVARIAEALEEARIGIEEAAFALRERTRDAEDDPARLSEIESRLDLLHELTRRYGPGLEQVVRTCDEADEELLSRRRDETELEELGARIEEYEQRLAAAGDALVTRRLEAGERLATEVVAELADLGMTAARLEVAHVPPAEDTDALTGSTASGPGRFELRIATNPGSDPRPLQQIASGGEVARVMLALKGRLAHSDRIPVIVFDEIDANVGGRLGTIVGAKMATLARHRQVVCVTHLPQIAAFAERHFLVTKSAGKDDTETRVDVLSDSRRVDELADMLGGDAGAEAARAQARALLDEAARRQEEVP